jgi:chaperonin GroEL
MPNQNLQPAPFYQIPLFGEDARKKIQKGLDIVCSAAKITLGPKGLNVYIDKEWGAFITNDGVTIVNSITLEDKFENMGAYTAKQASAATNDACGDGTTTTCILLQKIVEESFKSSKNAMELRAELMEASEEAIKLLKGLSKEVKNKKDIENVAIVSVESEKSGKMIADIINKIGDKGLVLVEESQMPETSFEIIKGFEVPKGYVAPLFATNGERMEAIYKNVPILVCKKISAITELVGLADKVSKAGSKQLVICCEDIDAAVIGALGYNKAAALFHTLPIKCSKTELEDIAGLTGAVYVSEESGIKFEDLEVEQLGKVKKIVTNDKKSVIIGTQSPREQILRIWGLIEGTKNLVEKERYQDRINKLNGKLAVIRVGAPVESDMKYQKLKIDDAVQAVKAAIAEGIVPGAGMTLYKISKKLPKTEGGTILAKALQEPLRQIIRNAGKDEAEIIGNLNQKGLKLGWDAKDDKYVDLLKVGIIDPTKVEISAIQNAVSAGATLVTTAVAITFKLEKYVSKDNKSL